MLDKAAFLRLFPERSLTVCSKIFVKKSTSSGFYVIILNKHIGE